MAKTINGIKFNDLSRIGKGSAFNNVINGDISSEADLQDYLDAGEEYRNIQSVLIDWNSAELDLSDSSIRDEAGTDLNGKKIINSTGELFADIDESFPFIRFGAA